ncbi:hypothetical protein VR44_06520 [Streptomyces katrae]|uniref:Uncharacterized protein n=1 Tax=Streptomyces katrae TaxID=68223 RepID=A0A0F4JSF1_9ACTN|nr:hypothetical protein VR44_06520 [Streptomyces katrae]
MSSPSDLAAEFLPEPTKPLAVALYEAGQFGLDPDGLRFHCFPPWGDAGCFASASRFFTMVRVSTVVKDDGRAARSSPSVIQAAAAEIWSSSATAQSTCHHLPRTLLMACPALGTLWQPPQGVPEPSASLGPLE